MQHLVSIQTSSPASSPRVPASRRSRTLAGPAFDGTIASACESIGISLEQMIEMMRWAKESDPRIRELLDGWDALDASERQVSGTAEAVRQRVGLKLPELLRTVAEVTYRIAIYKAQIVAALALPSVVERSIETALTEDGIADRKMLFQHSGFVPTPKGSQTNIAITQNTQANATSRSVVAVPPPEQTIRSLTERFNAIRGLPRSHDARTSDALQVERTEGVEEDGE
jgi:predicted TIM-barrel enzyme